METIFKETFSTSYGDTINVGKTQPNNAAEKKEWKRTEPKSEVCKKELDEDETVSKEKESSKESGVMWKGVLDTIDKNMV